MARRRTTTPETPEAPATGNTQTLTSDEGETRETIIEPTAPEEKEQPAVNSEWLAEKVGPYLESHPDETLFHIASDGQVFLGKDLTFALEHEKHIKGEGISTYRVQP